jgi:hypothetical protein
MSPQGVFGLSNACVTRDSSLIYYFYVPSGFLRCRIQASPVEAVLLVISDFLGAVWALESVDHP